MFLLAHGAKPVISLENQNFSEADEEPGAYLGLFCHLLFTDLEVLCKYLLQWPSYPLR